MEAQATYDDVNLLLRLYELRREARLREARRWFAANFKARSLDEAVSLCPPGSEQDASLRMVLSYWEMAASFITSGVLNAELFFQSGGEMLFVWERIRDILPRMREARKNPFWMKNVETVADSFIQWMKKRAPEGYDAFSAMVRGEQR
jgi:hypothetical protein